MTSTKLYLLATAISGLAVLIAGATASYVAVKGVERRLALPAGALGQTLATFGDFEATLRDIRGDADGPFGRRVAELRRRHPFTPPGDGRLGEAQLTRFLAVKRRLHAVDLEMVGDLAVERRAEPTLGNLVEWSFFNRLRRLRDTQAEALAEQRMSLEEYRFVQRSVLTAAIASGLTPAERAQGWSAAVGATFARTSGELDRALADPATPPERRRELAEARALMAAQSELVSGLAGAAEEALRDVPPENLALLERYREPLVQVLFAAPDLDAIDLFVAMEQAGVPM